MYLNFVAILLSIYKLPWYSEGLALRKNFSVGYPRTPNFSASLVSSVASTLANLISLPSSFKAWAALAYSGARCLQCPHHGASGIKYNHEDLYTLRGIYDINMYIMIPYMGNIISHNNSLHGEMSSGNSSFHTKLAKLFYHVSEYVCCYRNQREFGLYSTEDT